MDVELTNMVMVRDRETGKVLVQERIKSWKGWSFPGGHVEPRESFIDSAIREVREETGLEIKNLRYCGIIHWLNLQSGARYLVFLYKTDDYSGELLEATDEGRVFWATFDEIFARKDDNDFQRYIPMFLSDAISEAYGAYEDGEPPKIIYM